MKIPRQKYLNLIILVGVFLLAGLKFYYGGCRIWICGAFVTAVVAFMILSDFNEKPENKPENESENKPGK